MNYFANIRMFLNQGARNSAPAVCFALFAGRPVPITGAQFFNPLRFNAVCGGQTHSTAGRRRDNSASPPF